MPVKIVPVQDTTIPAGALNKRVVIEQPLDSADGQGGVTRTWVQVVSTWAYIESYKGQELFQAGQVYPILWTRIVVRYRPNTTITATMRLRYGSQIYNIRSVQVPGESLTTIDLLCERLQQSGSAH